MILWHKIFTPPFLPPPPPFDKKSCTFPSGCGILLGNGSSPDRSAGPPRAGRASQLRVELSLFHWRKAPDGALFDRQGTGRHRLRGLASPPAARQGRRTGARSAQRARGMTPRILLRPKPPGHLHRDEKAAFFASAYGTMRKKEAPSRREQCGWSEARAKAQPPSGRPVFCPSRSESAPREQARPDST